jgi:NAD(P)-dependent dehydrogenase (short-subunit alcohol dehydrogenase family)
MGGPYSASKHAVLGLTKTAALEYVRQNIRINAVCPVYTHSGMVDDLINTAPGMKDKMRRVIPLGGLANPRRLPRPFCGYARTKMHFAMVRPFNWMAD